MALFKEGKFERAVNKQDEEGSEGHVIDSGSTAEDPQP